MQYKFEIISNYFFTQNFVCFGCIFHTVIQSDSHSLVNTNGINQIQIGSWYWLKYYDVHGSPYQCTSLIIIIQKLILFLRLQFQIIKYLTQALAVPCMQCPSVIRWLKKIAYKKITNQNGVIDIFSLVLGYGPYGSRPQMDARLCMGCSA